MSLDKGAGYLVLKDKNRDRKYLFSFPIFCPECGRKLVYTPEELSKMYSKEELESFIKNPFRDRFGRKNATPYQIASQEDLEKALELKIVTN